MPDLHAVSREHFADKYWQPKTDYRFTAKDAYCPLVVHEMPKAMMYFPIAFIKQEDHFVPVALQGLKPGSNLYVAPNGQWLTRYVPLPYQAYPFQLVQNQTQADQAILCFDMASGLLSEQEGNPFFQDSQEPAQNITDIIAFLSKAYDSQQLTHRLCAQLQELDLIENWPLTIKLQNEETTITDLYRINEVALKRLDGETLARLSQSNALLLAYCQLLSAENTYTLQRLLQIHTDSQSANTPQAAQTEELFSSDSGSISFDNF